MGKNVSDDSAGQGSAKPHKYFEDQFDDEEVVFVFRKHPIVMRKGLIYSSFALLVGPVATMALTFLRPENPPTLNFFFLSLLASFGLSALIFMPSWIAWNFSVYIVTDQRLIQVTQKGLFHRSVVDLALREVRMVNYEVAGLEQTLLGFGTIMVQTQMGDLVVHEVHHPDRIAKKIQMVLRDQGMAAAAVPYEEPQASPDAAGNGVRKELYESEE